ncbi:MAG: CaiB/BaiF CoA transferase family protein [Dehalococcoidia bacterium]|jgi:crotonobetainyl-CoA:carnitine CoA-transferase CaiB-like acyl-CoA transferase
MSSLLSGVTVLDLTINVPGPFCSMNLSDLGARVIKIEPPGGDPLRSEKEMWDNLNRGKESIVLNLKSTKDKLYLSKLAKIANIVIEGWRPGVAKRLSADYETLKKENDQLIYCSISGFGQEGEWNKRPGHDINYLALSGYLDMQAKVEGKPWAPTVLLSDLSSGFYATIAILAALNKQNITKTGTYIDLSMTESAISLLNIEIGRIKSENHMPNVTNIPHYGVFECSDNKWYSLGIVHENHFWDRFCKTAGLEKFIGMNFDERLNQYELINKTLKKTFLLNPSYEWDKRLKELDIPGAIVISLEETLNTKELTNRKFFKNINNSSFMKMPFKFSSYDIGPFNSPPNLGQNTNEILDQIKLF